MSVPHPARFPPGDQRSALERLQLALLQCTTPAALADALGAFALSALGCRSARLLWALVPATDARHAQSAPPGALGDQEAWLIEGAAARHAPTHASAESGTQTAFALAGAPDEGWIALLVEQPAGAPAPESDPAWGAFLDAAKARARDLLHAAQQAQKIERLQSAERLQRALYAIADLASADHEMGEVLRGVHGIVGGLMYAENFFIVLYDERRDTLRFAYFVDSADPDAPDPEVEIPLAQMPHSLTVATIRQARSLMGPSKRLSAELGLASLDELGPDSEDWLGVPLIAAGAVRGAVVVQSYDAQVRFTEEDRALLGYVAQHILTALEHKQAQAELERRVEQRTRELVAEVRERERGEKLQRALFRIAELTATTASLAEFLGSVHQIVGELLYARNFFVALLNEDATGLDFPYAVDEQGDTFVSRPLGKGLTEHVLRSGQPLLLNPEDTDSLVASGAVRRIGPSSACWLGVPLIRGEKAVGVIVVQSYTPGVVYSKADQDLLTFVCLHLGNALERKQSQDSLRSANVELHATLARLRQTQGQLVEAEKMASLGGLVAGVAHEINTPLGISLTAASHLGEEAHRLHGRLATGELKRSELDSFGQMATDATDLIVRNLQRASQLVKSFKQVAVDQTVDTPRPAELGAELAGILAMLSPALKLTPHRVVLDCPEPIQLLLPAGALYQIVSNLVMNAVQHAFPGGRAGHVTIGVRRDGADIVLTCADDGAGMSDAVRAQIFDPFFTTRRAEGGTGLGLHILYNLVVQVLRGSVRCDTQLGKGRTFEIRWRPPA
jgi:signal transduction histidine kinase